MFNGLLALVLASLVATPVTAQFSDADIKCANSTFNTICEPSANTAAFPAYGESGMFFLASGLPFSRAISVKLRRHDTGAKTALEFIQFNAGTGGNETTIVSARQYLLASPSFTNAFTAYTSFPCSLFPERGNTTATFDYLLTHYYGEGCAANTTSACIPAVKDVRPSNEPKTVTIKYIAAACEDGN